MCRQNSALHLDKWHQLSLLFTTKHHYFIVLIYNIYINVQMCVTTAINTIENYRSLQSCFVHSKIEPNLTYIWILVLKTIKLKHHTFIPYDKYFTKLVSIVTTISSQVQLVKSFRSSPSLVYSHGQFSLHKGWYHSSQGGNTCRNKCFKR